MLTIFCSQKIIKERLIELIKNNILSNFISGQLVKWSLMTVSFCLILGSCKKVVKQKNLPVPEKEILESALELRANEGLVYHHLQPFTGYSVAYYLNDTLAERIAYVTGKKQGLYQKWYPTGVLSYEANYLKGRKHGISKTWWKNGVLRSESKHVKGVTNGNQKQWYKSGQLFKSMNIVDGREEGIQQAWRENGKIYNNYEAKNGRIFGLKRANLCYELEEEVVQY